MTSVQTCLSHQSVRFPLRNNIPKDLIPSVYPNTYLLTIVKTKVFTINVFSTGNRISHNIMSHALRLIPQDKVVNIREIEKKLLGIVRHFSIKKFIAPICLLQYLLRNLMCRNISLLSDAMLTKLMHVITFQ